MDLADGAGRHQVLGKIGAAHRDPDTKAALGQRPHQMPPDETRAAEHCHETI
jgi:hypothetical protein